MNHSVVAVLALFLSVSAADARTLLAVGDSIMLGVRPGVTVAQTFVAKIGAACGFSTVVNGAVAGETSTQTLARLPALLAAHDPDVVFLAPTPNNYGPIALSQEKAELIAMKDLVEASGGEVVFFTYMLWANGSYLSVYAPLERAMMQELGGMPGVQFVDVFAEQMRLMFYNGYVPGGANPWLVSLYAVATGGGPDWIHPSAIMHQYITDLAMQNPRVCDP